MTNFKDKDQATIKLRPNPNALNNLTLMIRMPMVSIIQSLALID